MTRDDLIARALSAVGHETEYVLGGGNSDPRAESPRDENGGCDCSAFVCWALGVKKYQPQISFLRRVNGGWFNTDGMWWDGMFERTGAFDLLVGNEGGVERGCVVVYPAHWVVTSAKKQGLYKNAVPIGPKIGHVGIVTEVRPSVRVVHCSSGNWRRHEDAIQVTDDAVFRAVSYRAYLWAATVDR